MQLENTPSAKRLRANTPKPLLSYTEIVINDSMVPNWSWVSDGTEHEGDCSSNVTCEMKDCEQSETPLRPLSPQESSPQLPLSASQPSPPSQFHLSQFVPFQKSAWLPQSPTLPQSASFLCTSPTTPCTESSSEETHVSMTEIDTSPLSDCPTTPRRMHSSESCSSKACTLCRTIDEVLLEEDRESVAARIASPEMQTHPCSSELSQRLRSSDGSSGSSKLSIEICGNVEILLPHIPIASGHISKMFGVHEEIEELSNVLKCILKWAVSVYSFNSLSPKSQEKLLQSSWCEICVLKIAIMQIAQDSTFVFSNGCSYTMEQIEDKRYLQILCDIKYHVTSWLNYMNVDRTENGHLMTLLLLNPGIVIAADVIVLNTNNNNNTHTHTRMHTKVVACYDVNGY